MLDFGRFYFAALASDRAKVQARRRSRTDVACNVFENLGHGFVIGWLFKHQIIWYESHVFVEFKNGVS